VPVTRRRLLAGLLAAPVVLVATTLADGVASATRGMVGGVRPHRDGTSATRCAQCGSPDHTMLDPACPLAPRVLR
jgi:hypothetical protein